MLAADVLPKVAPEMSTCSLSRRRAQLAEAAFLDIAEILSSAPDPTPLLSAAGALKASVDGMQAAAVLLHSCSCTTQKNCALCHCLYWL